MITTGLAIAAIQEDPCIKDNYYLLPILALMLVVFSLFFALTTPFVKKVMRDFRSKNPKTSLIIFGLVGLIILCVLGIGEWFLFRKSKSHVSNQYSLDHSGKQTIIPTESPELKNKNSASIVPTPKAPKTPPDILKSPNLRGEIITTYTNYFNGQAFVLVVVQLSNPTGPPSGLIKWNMAVEFPNGKKMLGTAPLKGGEEDLRVPGPIKGKRMVLPEKNYLPKICQSPIIAGSAVEGWFYSIFPGLNLEDAYKEHALIIIEAQDIVGNKKHKFSTTFEKQQDKPLFIIENSVPK